MQVRMAGAGSGNGEDESGQRIAIKSAYDLSADFVADHEHPQRNQVNIGEIPDFLLQRDACLELVNAGAFANGDSFHLRDGAIHVFWPAAIGFPSLPV